MRFTFYLDNRINFQSFWSDTVPRCVLHCSWCPGNILQCLQPIGWRIFLIRPSDLQHQLHLSFSFFVATSSVVLHVASSTPYDKRVVVIRDLSPCQLILPRLIFYDIFLTMAVLTRWFLSFSVILCGIKGRKPPCDKSFGYTNSILCNHSKQLTLQIQSCTRLVPQVIQQCLLLQPWT